MAPRRRATLSDQRRLTSAARILAPSLVIRPGASAPETRYHSHPKTNLSSKPLYRKGIRMNVLIGVLITFLVVILVLYLVNMLPLDSRARQIVRVIVIIIGVISLLKYLAVF
jgi:hypothetical protein